MKICPIILATCERWLDADPVFEIGSQKIEKCSLSESEIRSIILATCERWHESCHPIPIQNANLALKKVKVKRVPSAKVKEKFVPLFLLLVRGYMILIQNANLAFKKVKVNVEMVLSAKVKVKSFPLFLLLVWGDTIPIQIANSQKSKKCSFSDSESEKCFISESEIRSIILATCERWHNADLDCQLGSHFPFSQLNINYQKNWNLVTWLNDIGNFVE